MDKIIKDKVALITGASRGIGRAIALLFAAAGAKTAVNYNKSMSHAEKVVHKISENGGQAIAVKADVSDSNAVDAMVSEITEQYGEIDILVNNAALATIKGDTLSLPIEELFSSALIGGEIDLPPKKLAAMWSVNVGGVINCTQSTVPSMIQRRAGKIINISSIAGVGESSLKKTFYGLSKKVVIQYTKRMAIELGTNGVNINAICPGAIKTDMLTNFAVSTENYQSILDEYSNNSLLGRVGDPEDIASVALFLASSLSNYMTGEILTVDGGYSLKNH